MGGKSLVFISFADRDRGMALEFAMLLNEGGVRTFCAPEDIKPGDDWNDKVRQALIDCREVVILLSPESVDSDWVLMELGAAWVLNKKITPVLLFGDPARLPDPLRRIQYATITSIGGW